jgi:hypothetical protein
VNEFHTAVQKYTTSYYYINKKKCTIQRQLSVRTLRHLAECRRRGLGGTPAVVERGDLDTGVMGVDMFRSA